MNKYFRDDPIVAVSTGTQSQSAIGIIRVSGFKSLDFLSSLCGLTHLKPRFAHYATLMDGDDILDDGILLYFPAPNSFTGENVLEFQVHGNPFNLERIVSCLMTKFGFLKAFPGEFTYRALKNKKLNLTQVEGLDLLLNASSSFGLSKATKIMNNELFDEYIELRNLYISLRSSIELSIDFSEDVGEEEIVELIRNHADRFSKAIDLLHKRTEGDLSNLLTPKVGLYGETNAGKSTLFNSLVGQDRAIVSDIHGTTRDFVSEYIYIDSQAYQLIDTAGLRESLDVIEKEGIKRGKRLVDLSFLKFFIINASTWDGSFPDVLPSAYVLTHIDIIEKGDIDRLLGFIRKSTCPVFISGPIGAKSLLGPIGADDLTGPIEPIPNYYFGPMGPVLFYKGSLDFEFVKLDGPMGAGEDGSIGPVVTLNSMISTAYKKLSSVDPIPLERHRELIKEIFSKFDEIKDILFKEADIGLISHEINALSMPIDELLGVVRADDVLDNIFSNFCIGK